MKKLISFLLATLMIFSLCACGSSSNSASDSKQEASTPMESAANDDIAYDEEDVTTGFTCSPTTLNKEGTQAITVTYGGKSTSFTVKVSKANDDVQSITIAVQPTKLTYKVGERLDTTGMKLTVRTSSETKDITTGFTCTPTSFTKAGEYEIKVIYGGKETTFKVAVTEDASASPEASATPTVSPTPSSEPQPVAKKSNALLIVGIIAAILALAALGAYVYVMNRGKGGRRRR